MLSGVVGGGGGPGVFLGEGGGGRKLRGKEVSVSEILPDYFKKKKKKVALRYHLSTKCAACEFYCRFHIYNSKRFARSTL